MGNLVVLHVLPVSGCRISTGSVMLQYKRPIDGRVRCLTVYSNIKLYKNDNFKNLTCKGIGGEWFSKNTKWPW